MIYQKQEVKYLGYIDKGTGPHISNAVYSTLGEGLCPTLLHDNYKAPTMIVVKIPSETFQNGVDKPN